MNCETELPPVVVVPVTATMAVPAIDPVDAVIVTLPADTPVTNPEALTAATVVLEEVQLTELVSFWVLLLL